MKTLYPYFSQNPLNRLDQVRTNDLKVEKKLQRLQIFFYTFGTEWNESNINGLSK